MSGGYGNEASGPYSTISGGGNNIASGNGATISGGSYLTVPDVGGYAP